MARAPRQPGLFEADSPPLAAATPLRALDCESPAARHAGRRLWLGLYFPDLPLAALPGDGLQPRAILSQVGRQARVHCCDLTASRHGVRPGLPANAALALLPELELLPRDLQREHRLLSKLADLATVFTPCVSIVRSATLVLEIGGSLRLFGDADQLRALILQSLRERGHAVETAVAPTARAAGWLACAQTGARVLDRAMLAGQLGVLPIAGLPWPEARRRTLREMGVETLSDCVRLPRDGLARRLGARLLEELDQAYARRPEALDWYRPEQHFHDRVELEQESADTRQLIAALDILVDRLVTQMRSRQRSVHRVWLHCEHRDGPATRIRIGLLRATAEPARLRELGRVQLAAATVPAPVTAVSLQAALDATLTPLPGDLLNSEVTTAEDALAFVERLRARLGAESVHGLQTRAEYRPERAWQAVREPGVAPGSGEASMPAAGQRPLWMLPVPIRLREAQGRPVFQGALQISRGPERIETGWWDGGDVRRDYYVAQNQRGVQLWIYRDLRETRWYLHGLFG